MEVNFKYYSEALHYFSKDAVLGFSVNGGIRLLYFFCGRSFSSLLIYSRENRCELNILRIVFVGVAAVAVVVICKFVLYHYIS